ncbi:TRA2 [Lepeophtheirus salmonis]|uniref:TRA2 n=1 Tax=Lepeophtheirus salmonis TaxID=72036 RepID=A0A7R8CFV3_LEPSM|nr:TRA2 [Lepeophtheirus salmonis]CAF2809987.1 TRA2 [Lepeophtheirus salmonis]
MDSVNHCSWKREKRGENRRHRRHHSVLLLVSFKSPRHVLEKPIFGPPDHRMGSRSPMMRKDDDRGRSRSRSRKSRSPNGRESRSPRKANLLEGIVDHHDETVVHLEGVGLLERITDPQEGRADPPGKEVPLPREADLKDVADRLGEVDLLVAEEGGDPLQPEGDGVIHLLLRLTEGEEVLLEEGILGLLEEEEEEEVEASNVLGVFGLSYSTDEHDLNREFSRFGALESIRIVRDPERRSRGFGFIDFKYVEDAKQARRALCDTNHMEETPGRYLGGGTWRSRRRSRSFSPRRY